MRQKKGKTIRILRILSQWIFSLLFLSLFFLPAITGNDLTVATEYFFYVDPLFLISSLVLSESLILFSLVALVPFFLTLVLGRFFCGWVCPMGSIHQFFSWIFYPFRQNARRPDTGQLGLKYLILAALIMAMLPGVNFIGWVDPFSLLTRSLSVFTPLADPGHVSLQPFVIGGIFLILIALNAVQPRFYCNVLCPLGALYGILSRFGFLRFRTGASCTRCHTCSAHCTFGGDAGEHFLKSECMVCFHCVADCRDEAVSVSFGSPARDLSASVTPGRRKFIGALVLGAVIGFLPKTTRSAKPARLHGWLRPPGARNEEDFLALCERCGQCVQSCPTGFIQPAALEAGVIGIWTPVVSGKAGYCEWTCHRCTQVCPSKAIEKLTLKEKQRFRIGTAVIDRDRCYTYADGFNCTACQERCPTPEKAIRFRPAEVWNYQGKRSVVNQVYVNPDLCTGCGICEYFCPRTDAPAIYLVSEDECREYVTGPD